MTRLLEEALENVRALPSDMQDEIARLLMQLTGKSEPAPLSAADEASFDESFAQAARGEFVSEDVIEAFWKQHGL